MTRSNIILLVDDDTEIRDGVADILADEGYCVACAADGLAALEYLRTHPPPCVILLDCMMPRCTGSEFRSLQLARPELAEIPVVLVTAEWRAMEQMRALRANGLLRKPVKVDDLLATIAQYAQAA